MQPSRPVTLQCRNLPHLGDQLQAQLRLQLDVQLRLHRLAALHGDLHKNQTEAEPGEQKVGQGLQWEKCACVLQGKEAWQGGWSTWMLMSVKTLSLWYILRPTTPGTARIPSRKDVRNGPYSSSCLKLL